jgi:hypothetical protein
MSKYIIHTKLVEKNTYSVEAENAEIARDKFYEWSDITEISSKHHTEDIEEIYIDPTGEDHE